MRIVSSDFSFRLCAFSVFSARILNATSASGTTSATIGLRAKLSHRLKPVIAVRRPIAVVLPDRDDRIEESAERLDHGHQPLDVRLGRIALIRRRLDAIDRQRSQDGRRAAERLTVGRQHGASSAAISPASARTRSSSTDAVSVASARPTSGADLLAAADAFFFLAIGRGFYPTRAADRGSHGYTTGIRGHGSRGHTTGNQGRGSRDRRGQLIWTYGISEAV